MHQQCADTASSRKMFTSMGSRPIILLICLAITVVIAHPYGDQQLAAAQGPGYDYRGVELRPITYRKHFHFFAAPEEADTFDEEIPEELLKKDINVVVIRAPENNKATATIARLAKTLAEEKTAIYVLNKEPDLKEITAHIERFKDKKTIRPEVHFIKYKTAEEADLAARNIQVEYDALRGPSEVEHQLTAALHSYVGLLDDGGVQEMQLVSFYGRPRHEGHSLLKSSSDDASKGELASSFYLPPEGEATNAPVLTAGDINLGSEDIANAGGSELSSSFYLPPSDETNLSSVRSDYGKRSASAPTESSTLSPETVTEESKTETTSSTAKAIEELATSTESSSSTTATTEKLATTTESVSSTTRFSRKLNTSPTTKRRNAFNAKTASTAAVNEKFSTTTESVSSTTRFNRKLGTSASTTERTESNAKAAGKRKSSRGRFRYSHSEKNKKDQLNSTTTSIP